MAQYVEINGEIVEFPDNMSDEQITAVIKKQQPSKLAPESASTYTGKGDWDMPGMTPEIRKVAEPIAKDVAFTGATMMAPVGNLAKIAKYKDLLKWGKPLLQQAGIGAAYGLGTSKGDNLKDVGKDIGTGAAFGAAGPLTGRGLEKVGEGISTLGGWGGGLRKELTDYAKEHFPKMIKAKKNPSLLVEDITRVYDNLSSIIKKKKNILGDRIKKTLPDEMEVSDIVKYIDDEIANTNKFTDTTTKKQFLDNLNSLREYFVIPKKVTPEQTQVLKGIDESLDILKNSAKGAKDKNILNDLNKQISELEAEKTSIVGDTLSKPQSKEQLMKTKSSIADLSNFDEKTAMASVMPDVATAAKDKAHVSRGVLGKLTEKIDDVTPESKLARKKYETLLKDLEGVTDKISGGTKPEKLRKFADYGLTYRTDPLEKGFVKKASKAVPKAQIEKALVVPEAYKRVFSTSLPEVQTVNPYSLLARYPGALATTALGAGAGYAAGDTTSGALTGLGLGAAAFSPVGIRNSIRLSNLVEKAAPTAARGVIPSSQLFNKKEEKVETKPVVKQQNNTQKILSKEEMENILDQYNSTQSEEESDIPQEDLLKYYKLLSGEE